MELHVGISILRVPEGLDYSTILGDDDKEKPIGTISLEPDQINAFPFPDKNVPDIKIHKQSRKAKRIFMYVFFRVNERIY